jgi:hypothetical protein
MPTNNAVLSAREAFEQGTAAAASAPDKLSLALKPQRTAQPAEQSSASAQIQSQPAADASADDNIDAADSSAAADVSSDDNVDSSAADTTTADASDDSEHADLTSETADQQPPKAKGRAQARIEDLVASNKALKQSLEYLQNEVLAKLPQQQAAAQPAPAVTTTPAAPAAEEAPPTLESCGFDTDKWTQAIHAWTKKQIAAGVTQAVQTVKQEQTTATRVQAFQTREAAFAATAPDYGVVIGNPALPRFAPEPAQLVLDSEVGPQILYHLGKNPEKAARIARMAPVQQAAAIGRLEAELVAKPSTQKKTTTNITKAPPPPTATKGNGGAPTTDPTKMPVKDFIAQERERMAARRTGRR